MIGLPANLFYNTGIPTCIIVLKKHREGRDVLFIDASKLFEKQKKQNVMNEEHIGRVLELYKNRADVDKTAHVASFEEIKANDFNLNIPRYVDSTEKEPEIELGQLTSRMEETNKAIKEGNESLLGLLGELTFKSDDTRKEMERFISALKGV